jgi:hypothetical protein
MLSIQIRVDGRIDESWSEWFQNLKIEHVGSRHTILSGVIKDQAELYGMLARLWNLRLGLISVQVEDAI